jgi:hypothetical protein
VAIAELGFALGAVDESLVTSYGAAVRALEVQPPPHPTPTSEVPPGPEKPSPTPDSSPTPTTPTTTPVETLVESTTPEDSLDLALSKRPIPSADTKVFGPGRDAPGVDTFQPICGEYWLAVDPADQLAYSVEVHEGAERRELRTYPTADAAVAELANIRAALGVCTEESIAGGDTIRWREFPSETGYDGSVTFGFTYADGLAGYLFTLTRVGLGILAVQYGGEYSADALRSVVDAQVSLVRALTDDMCTFTEDGC